MNKVSVRAVLHVSSLPASGERAFDFREKRTSATLSSKTVIDKMYPSRYLDISMTRWETPHSGTSL